MGNSVECPYHAPGANIIGADIAGPRCVFFIGRRAENKKILEDAPGIVRLHEGEAFRVAPQALPQIHASARAELHDRPAGSRIDCLKTVVYRKQEAPVGAVRALPVVEPAIGQQRRLRVLERTSPYLLAGGGTQGD